MNTVDKYIEISGVMCDRSGYDVFVVSRKNFEAWLTLLNLQHTFLPDYCSSKIKLFGKFATGASFTFEAHALKVISMKQIYFGRGDEWNAVKVSMKHFHFTGEGARSEATRAEAELLFTALV